jgi:DNA polymerase III delta subunit
VSNVIIVSGGEEFLMERAAREEASSRLFGEVLEFRFSSGSESYADESRSPVFPGPPRAFIVWGCESVPEPPEGPDDLLVAVAPAGKELSLPGAVRSLNFPALKVQGDKNEYVGWILREGERLNIDLSRVAGALFVNCGGRLRKLSSEIEKLSLLSQKGSTVTPDTARSVLCFSAEVTPKDVVDAVCEGRTSVAIAYYDRLQELGDETGWILSYIHRHVIQMLRIEDAAASGMDEASTSELLGVNPFVLKKFMAPMRGRWSRESLAASVRTLSSADEMNKTGAGLAEYFLESEIVRLSEEARNVHGR